MQFDQEKKKKSYSENKNAVKTMQYSLFKDFNILSLPDYNVFFSYRQVGVADIIINENKIISAGGLIV